ncbi:Translation initiation factor 1, partial [uncultured Rubrobacteraceae bacterium]
PGRTRQRAQRAGAHLGQDADELHPDIARRQGKGGVEPLRLEPGTYHLQVQDL